MSFNDPLHRDRQSIAYEIRPRLPAPQGCCCGFLGKEWLALGGIAFIGTAIVAIGILGISNTIPMGFVFSTPTIPAITISTVIPGGVITGLGGCVFLIMLYGVCFVCQAKANRSRSIPLGHE